MNKEFRMMSEELIDLCCNWQHFLLWCPVHISVNDYGKWYNYIKKYPHSFCFEGLGNRGIRIKLGDKSITVSRSDFDTAVAMVHDPNFEQLKAFL